MPLPYRPCVGVMLLNAEGHAFVGRRKGGAEHVDATHAWQMPQGGIDPGEDPYHAALRELHEETNVRSVQLIAEASDWFAYDLPPDVMKSAWRGRFRGQTQKWFALRFTGHESEIDIHQPAGGMKAEFSAWKWVPVADLPALIIGFKRPVYDKVVAEFARYATPV